MLTTRYTFRELQTPAEMEAMFRLRFHEFSKLPWYAAILEGNTTGLDIDRFDEKARHFGLFHHSFFGKETLVGGLRIILDEKNRGLEQLIQQRGWAPARSTENAKPFYFYDYFPDADALLGNDRLPGKRICEPSRLILDSRFRSFGLADFMARSVAVAVCSLSIDEAVVTGRSFLVPFYKRIGFRLIKQEQQQGHNGYASAMLRMTQADAANHIPGLAQKIADWQKNPVVSTQISRFGAADLLFLWKKARRSFFKKITAAPVTSPQQQVQMAN